MQKNAQIRPPPPAGLVLAAVLALTFAAFFPSLDNSLATWDDEVHLLHHKPVAAGLTLANLRTIFTETINSTYIPLTTLSFAAEHAVAGFTSWVYHLVNVLLHLAVTALVFFLCRRWGAGAPAAGLAALLFGVHPLRAESVAWATERKDVLYALFYLLSVHAYLSWRRFSGRPLYWLAVAAGLLSILAKPMALSLPLILFLIDWKEGRRFDRRALLDKIPLLLVIVPCAAVTYSLNARVPGHHGPVQAALTWVWTLMFYLRKFVWPRQLLPLYGLPQPVSIASWHYFAPLAAAAGLGAALWRLRRHRDITFAFLWFFLSIFFLLRFDDVADVNIVADRFMYLPCLGFCYLAGLGGERLIAWGRGRFPGAKAAVPAVLALVFVGLAAKTYQQNRVWRDDFTLWSAVLAKRPDSYRAHFGLGQTYYERGDRAKAEEHYRITLRLKPDHAKAHNNLGDFAYSDGKFDEALAHFAAAVQFKPDYAEARNNLGVLLAEAGRFDEAAEQLNEAVRLEPDKPEYRMSLGDYFFKRGDLSAALDAYREAAGLAPDDPRVHNRLGVVLLKRGNPAAAAQEFEESLRLAPSGANARHNLATARRALAAGTTPARR